MPLSDTKVRNATPGPKPYKLSDERGLYLEVSPSGGKWWRLKYRIDGKEKRISLGVYPDVKLKEARDRRDEARKLIAAGIDPSRARQEEKAARKRLAANTLEIVSRHWIGAHLKNRAPSYRKKITSMFERLVFPYLGTRPIDTLTAPEILEVARRIEAGNKSETARRIIQNIGQVYRYAMREGLVNTDPTQALRGAITPSPTRHMAAPTDPASVGGILRALEAFTGSPTVAAAIKLLPLLFVRPGELRTMRWEQIDFEAKEWRYTTSKTKTEHLVPLSRQAIAVLKALQPITGHLAGGWVLPGGRSPRIPMSNVAVNAAYRRLGIDTRTELTGHGWRACARTLLHERLGFAPEVIEHQLAHSVPDTLGRAYNRTRFIAERRKMMQQWADYLDTLKAGAEVIPLHGKRAG